VGDSAGSTRPSVIYPRPADWSLLEISDEIADSSRYHLVPTDGHLPRCGGPIATKVRTRPVLAEAPAEQLDTRPGLRCCGGFPRPHLGHSSSPNDRRARQLSARQDG